MTMIALLADSRAEMINGGRRRRSSSFEVTSVDIGQANIGAALAFKGRAVLEQENNAAVIILG
jgi:hypothetical protein